MPATAPPPGQTGHRDHRRCSAGPDCGLPLKAPKMRNPTTPIDAYKAIIDQLVDGPVGLGRLPYGRGVSSRTRCSPRVQ